MSTSEKELKRHLRCHLIASGLLAVFGEVYELFSHGVYSAWMLFAFAFPLLPGALLYALLLRLGILPGRVFLNLWNAGVACLSVGSVFQGVLAIYGTTNSLIVVYPLVGGALLLLGVMSAFLPPPRTKRHHGD